MKSAALVALLTLLAAASDALRVAPTVRTTLGDFVRCTMGDAAPRLAGGGAACGAAGLGRDRGLFLLADDARLVEPLDAALRPAWLHALRHAASRHQPRHERRTAVRFLGK